MLSNLHGRSYQRKRSRNSWEVVLCAPEGWGLMLAAHIAITPKVMRRAEIALKHHRIWPQTFWRLAEFRKACSFFGSQLFNKIIHNLGSWVTSVGRDACHRSLVPCIWWLDPRGRWKERNNFTKLCFFLHMLTKYLWHISMYFTCMRVGVCMPKLRQNGKKA